MHDSSPCVARLPGVQRHNGSAIQLLAGRSTCPSAPDSPAKCAAHVLLSSAWRHSSAGATKPCAAMACSRLRAGPSPFGHSRGFICCAAAQRQTCRKPPRLQSHGYDQEPQTRRHREQASRVGERTSVSLMMSRASAHRPSTYAWKPWRKRSRYAGLAARMATMYGCSSNSLYKQPSHPARRAARGRSRQPIPCHVGWQV
eukprot:scaffold2903_cov336-Prasinococcus_capsulatus_cf.AAC.2